MHKDTPGRKEHKVRKNTVCLTIINQLMTTISQNASDISKIISLFVALRIHSTVANAIPVASAMTDEGSHSNEQQIKAPALKQTRSFTKGNNDNLTPRLRGTCFVSLEDKLCSVTASFVYVDFVNRIVTLPFHVLHEQPNWTR